MRRIKAHPLVDSCKQRSNACLVIQNGRLQLFESVEGRISTTQQVSLESIKQGGDLGSRERGGRTSRVGIVNDGDARQSGYLAAQLIDGTDQVGLVSGREVGQRTDLTVNGLELGGKA